MEIFTAPPMTAAAFPARRDRVQDHARRPHQHLVYLQWQRRSLPRIMASRRPYPGQRREFVWHLPLRRGWRRQRLPHHHAGTSPDHQPSTISYQPTRAFLANELHRLQIAVVCKPHQRKLDRMHEPASADRRTILSDEFHLDRHRLLPAEKVGLDAHSSDNNAGGLHHVLLNLCPAIGPAQTFQELHAFLGSGDGAVPYGALIEGRDGNFYGVTQLGGPSECGSAFKITPDGAFTSLAAFDGTNSVLQDGGLVQASDGNFYGTTTDGGPDGLGTVFRVSPGGGLAVMSWFNGYNGETPLGDLIEGRTASSTE